MTNEREKLTFQDWIDSPEGKATAANVYLSLSDIHPTIFEIQQKLREEYERYLWKVKNAY